MCSKQASLNPGTLHSLIERIGRDLEAWVPVDIDHDLGPIHNNSVSL